MTIKTIKQIISRANQKLETVEWQLRYNNKYRAYKLVKHIQLRTRQNEPYWWPTIIIPEMVVSSFTKAFVVFCESNKRDTLSKAYFTHEDALAIKKDSKKVQAVLNTQLSLF